MNKTNELRAILTAAILAMTGEERRALLALVEGREPWRKNSCFPRKDRLNIGRAGQKVRYDKTDNIPNAAFPRFLL